MGQNSFWSRLQDSTDQQIAGQGTKIPVGSNELPAGTAELPSGVSYNSVHKDTTTLQSGADSFAGDFPQGFYYYGFIVNKGSSDITVSILKQDGNTIEGLIMEANTRLVVKGLNIMKLIVEAPATFRYDFIGNSKQPLAGNETLDIITYVVQTSNVISLEVESLPFTVPQNGTVFLQLVGTNNIASVSFDNGATTYELNGGSALGTNELYEFEIHVAQGDIVTVSGATPRETFYEA